MTPAGSPQETIRVLLGWKDRQEREEVRQMLSRDPRMEITGMARDGQEAVQMAFQLRPHVVLLDAALPILNAFEAAEFVTLGVPEVFPIIVGAPDTPDAYRHALRCGARACLPKPVDSSQLLNTVGQLYEMGARKGSADFLAATDPARLPRVICVTSAKGGTGKSTVSTNLAVALAREFPDQVVLLDLYTQFGDVATMMNLEPKRTMVELAGHPDIDSGLLDHYLMPHDSGVRVLIGTSGMSAFDSITVAVAEKVLNILKSRYRFVILDVPPILARTTLYAISHSYAVLLITGLFDMHTLKDTRLFQNAIAGKYVGEHSIKIVLNRVNKQNRLQVADVEDMLGQPTYHQIPNDPGNVDAVNQGIPITMVKPDSEIATSFQGLARKLAAPGNEFEPMNELEFPAEPETADGKKRWRFLNFLGGEE